MRSAGRRLHTGLAAVLAVTLSSCAHNYRSPIADAAIEVRATPGSALVVRSQHAGEPSYELRKSLRLKVTPYGELTGGGRGFSPPVVFQVEPRLHCELNPDGELFVSTSDSERTIIARLPVFLIPDDRGGGSSISQRGYDELVATGERGTVEPVAFDLIRSAGGAFVLRAAE